MFRRSHVVYNMFSTMEEPDRNIGLCSHAFSPSQCYFWRHNLACWKGNEREMYREGEKYVQTRVEYRNKVQWIEKI